MDYKSLLNKEQYEAVMTKDGPILVLAGAGSGKTRVITYRIANLIENFGIAPYNILAITFTNKAAREMRDRVEQLLGDDCSGIWIGTFHATCGRMLRMFPECVGYDKNFVVYDDDDSIKAIKDAMKTLGIDSKSVTPKQILGIISKAKEQMLSPEDFAKEVDKFNPIAVEAAKVYKEYQAALIKANAMDFDDMIVNAVKMLRENETARNYFNNKFRYVLVDEYQDTNNAQFELVSLLSPHKNLCVVGDDDQSIYSFRGADISNILNFEKIYKDCKVIKLEQNYRSTQNILNAANAVIKVNHEDDNKQKKLWSADGSGEKIYRYCAENQNDEASFVAREIIRLEGLGHYKYSDMVVLYRQNRLSQTLERAFATNGIPYRVYGGFKFFQRQEIKYIINYLRLFDNPNDNQALKEIINVPSRKIGDTSIEKAMRIAEREHCPLLKVVSIANKYPELSRASKAMMEFSQMVYSLIFQKDDMGVAEFTELVIETVGLVEMYRNSNDDDDKDRIENLKEFLNVAKEFEDDAREDEEKEGTFTEFLEYLALSTDMDKDGEGNDNFVRMMTVHASKGLEFPVVFIIGLEESIFPSQMAMDEGNLSEERRLCYVAITRAAKQLYLLSADERMYFGRTSNNPTCKFLEDIPGELLKYVDFRGREVDPSSAKKSKSFGFYGNFGKSYGFNSSERSGSTYLTYGNSENSYNKRNKPASADKPSFGKMVSSVADVEKFNLARKEAEKGDKDLSVGDRVLHLKFGEGNVTKIDKNADDSVIEIKFDKLNDIKRFSLKFTKLKKL